MNMSSHVQDKVIHNSQDMESTKVSIYVHLTKEDSMCVYFCVCVFTPGYYLSI